MKQNTKRILAVIMVALFLVSAAACGKKENKDELKLTVYTSDAGISVTLPEGMQEDELDGFVAFYYNDNCMMTAIKETFEVYTSLGVDVNTTTLEDYAKMVEQANGLKTAFSADGNNNLAVTYTNTSEGNTFFYYTTIRKGSDAFWVVSFACLENQKDAYQSQFETWGNSIEVK